MRRVRGDSFSKLAKPLTFIGEESGVIRLVVPTRFMQNWIESQYGDRLLALWRGENPSIKEVSVVHVGRRETANSECRRRPSRKSPV